MLPLSLALVKVDSRNLVINIGEETLNICLKDASRQNHSKLDWPIQILIGKI